MTQMHAITTNNTLREWNYRFQECVDVDRCRNECVVYYILQLLHYFFLLFCYQK